MKKSLFMIAGAAIALASCSMDESIETNKGRSIDFRASLLTRAVETTTANLEKFTVTAINDGNNYFTNVEFSRKGSFFASNPEYYWPGDGSQVDFYAFSPTSLSSQMTVNPTSKTLENFSPAAQVKDQVDFIAATASGSKDNEATGVALEFGHKLAQIEIHAKCASEVYTYKVKGVKIGKNKSSGQYDFSTDSWTLGEGKSIYSYTYETPVVLAGEVASMMDATSGNPMLLPQQLVAWNPTEDNVNTAGGAYLSLLINLETKEGTAVYPKTKGGYSWASVAIDTNWEAGKKYIYVLDFTNGAGRVDPDGPNGPDSPGDNGGYDPGDTILGGPIQFNVNVLPWEAIDPGINVTM